MYYLITRYYDPWVGQFISPDSFEYLDVQTIGGINLYAYCGNNPIMYTDPTGEFWDTVFDIGFIIWGIIDLVNGGYKDWGNWVALGVDVLFAVVPFIPSGAGQVIKVGNKIDNITNMHKVTLIGRNMNRVTNVAQLLDKTSDLYKVWKGYDVTAKGLKRFLHNSISVSHDAFWLYRKLRSGYTVIDIGLSTVYSAYGLWYGAEKLILNIWISRNLWKVPINFF